MTGEGAEQPQAQAAVGEAVIYRKQRQKSRKKPAKLLRQEKKFSY
jgi:hypothetical protein